MEGMVKRNNQKWEEWVLKFHMGGGSRTQNYIYYLRGIGDRKFQEDAVSLCTPICNLLALFSSFLYVESRPKASNLWTTT
ncbi:hypothetical protein VNO77_25254 [Canavalia gladiata]|uniref:Uncharacterized protein n=1 Tax=Canavalia gladiata TaxID=3824 RepID=A0AAN9L7T0_CANGL